MTGRVQSAAASAGQLDRLGERRLPAPPVHEVDSQQVLELERDSGCSAYDCEFVSLAARLGVKLLTSDNQVLKAFPQHTLALAGA